MDTTPGIPWQKLTVRQWNQGHSQKEGSLPAAIFQRQSQIRGRVVYYSQWQIDGQTSTTLLEPTPKGKSCPPVIRVGELYRVYHIGGKLYINYIV